MGLKIRFMISAIVLLLVPGAWAQEMGRLARVLEELIAPLQTWTTEPLTVRVTGCWQTDRGSQQATVRFIRVTPADFSLSVDVHPVTLTLKRSAEHGFLYLPDKQTLIVTDHSPLVESDLRFTLQELERRLAARSPQVAGMLALLKGVDPTMLPAIAAAVGMNVLPEGDAGEAYAVSKGGNRIAGLILDPEAEGRLAIETDIGGTTVTITLSIEWGNADVPQRPVAVPKVLTVRRSEFETVFLKGTVRALEILIQDQTWTPPGERVARVGKGCLRVKDGQRIMRLQGSPREMGSQHGRLLQREVVRGIESTLYVVGLYYSVERGVWFLDTLRQVAARTEPHIPEDYIEEMRGLAEGAGVDYQDVRLANIFPEMFHCSGFAVSGPATVDGRLYHGRVLDYMTNIGLQYDAVVTAVVPDGRIPFVNIGYAGVVGSVTGLNAEQVAAGEMGGGGHGLWDGVPMTFLMRMALERAATLDEAMRLFTEHRRTCEYYYVLSDGKDRTAVGVKAVPDSIEFVKPGEAHPLLPTPVEGCVLLSQGGRYEELVRLTREAFGRIGPPEARRLMGVPVAMASANLHNVLMCPETGELWVANAGRRSPACAQKYHAYRLAEIMDPEYYK
jgi:hypothetical protein